VVLAFASRSQNRNDPFRSPNGRFVFPNTFDVPASLSQFAIGVEVAATVCFEFVGPPGSIGLRECAMDRAAVPETTVDKDGYFGAGENDIGSPSAREDRPINSESKSTGVQ